MKHFVQKLLLIFQALTLLIVLGLPVSADEAYSVNVGSNTVNFLQNGKTVGTYAASDSNLTLMVNSDGALLVCFNNAPNRYVGVTLGSQRNLAISGTIGVLTIDKSYVGTVDSAALTTRLRVNGNAMVNQRNGVGLLEGADSASFNIHTGVIINKAVLTSSGARITVQSGGRVTEAQGPSSSAVVCIGPSADGKQPSGVVGTFKTTGKGSSNSNSNSNSSANSNSEIHFSTKTIYAVEGDTLLDLEGDLYDSVGAYNKDNRRVEGTFEWTSSDSVTLKRTGTHRFKFIPDSSAYKTTQGSIRVVVEDDEAYDYYIEVDDIVVTGDEKTLGDLKSQLKKNSTAYNSETDKKIPGTVQWEDRSSTRVKESGYYDFIFKPSSSRYEEGSGRIYIQVN